MVTPCEILNGVVISSEKNWRLQLIQVIQIVTVLFRTSGVTIGVTGARAPQPRCPIQNFEKIVPHLRLQDTKCSNIEICPLEKVVHPLVPPWKLNPSYATVLTVVFYCHFDHPQQYKTMLLPVKNGRLILTLLHVRFDSVRLLSALDIPWQVYQHFDWFWPLQSQKGQYVNRKDVPGPFQYYNNEYNLTFKQCIYCVENSMTGLYCLVIPYSLNLSIIRHKYARRIDEFQINEINVDLRTSGFDNEVLSVDACAVWWERESFYCLRRISVVTWHREPRFQCGSARTCSIWNSSIQLYLPASKKMARHLLTIFIVLSIVLECRGRAV